MIASASIVGSFRVGNHVISLQEVRRAGDVRMVRQDPCVHHRDDDIMTTLDILPGRGEPDPTRREAGAGAIVLVMPLIGKSFVVWRDDDALDPVRLCVLNIAACPELLNRGQSPIGQLFVAQRAACRRWDAEDLFSPGGPWTASSIPRAAAAAASKLRVGFIFTITSPGTKRGFSDGLPSSVRCALPPAASVAGAGAVVHNTAAAVTTISRVLRVIMAASLSCIVWKTVLLSQSQATNQMRVAWLQPPAWVLLVTWLLATWSIAASSARFVPGEVIVQFAPGSEGHRIVTQASGQPAPDLADFAPIVMRLATTTSIPLTAKQLLSGQRLLLKIDANRIVHEAAGRLREKPGVRTAGLDETGSGPSQLSPLELTIRVESTQGSSLSHWLAEAADNLDSPARERLLAELQTDLAIPLTIRTVHRETVLLDVDLPALTRLTVQRLSSISEIENAQSNHLFSIRTPEP